MWRNPKYADQQPQPGPPDDDGVQLAEIARGDGREVLRLTVKEFNGARYVAIRVWECDRDGGWWPVAKKGCSVRMGEIPKVIAALQQADAIARGGSRPGPQQPRQAEAGPRGGRSPGNPARLTGRRLGAVGEGLISRSWETRRDRASSRETGNERPVGSETQNQASLVFAR